MVELCRGEHPEYVFTYRDDRKFKVRRRVETMNNSSWQKGRKRAGLAHVRVHDLRHTFAQRLRDAGVAKEDRNVLMGHATEDMGEHYATPTVARLVELANMVTGTRDTTTLLRVVNGR
jgi:integrase